MKRIITGTLCLSAACCALPLLSSAFADGAPLKLISSGATRKVGGYLPVRLQLTSEKPEGARVLPEGLKSPLYGVVSLGPLEKPNRFNLLFDDPEGAMPVLYADSNGNGDFSDDARPEWKPVEYAGANGLKLIRRQGSVDFAVKFDGGAETLRLQMYKFDPTDPGRAAYRNLLLFYTDFAREGKVEIGGKSYSTLLWDRSARGDFRGNPAGPSSGVTLLIDRNEDGSFDSRYEGFDVRKPFNLGGTTYEISGLSASGASLTVVKSSKEVAEVAIPPRIEVGKPALAFERPSTEGKKISFPSTYKGKIVLLDFWATWCGPCIKELPHLTAAYKKFHESGFEVLGISLDRENAAEKLASFTKQHEMPWAQVYDGKFWDAEIAKMYGVDSIPRAYLVDGDTGMILATGNDLRGAKLEETIEKALKVKGLK